MNKVLKISISVILCIWTGIVIFLNFSPVFLENPIDDNQKAYENIRHAALEHEEESITLKTREVLLLLDKTRIHNIGEWRSRFYHIVLSCFVFLCSFTILVKTLRNKQ